MQQGGIIMKRKGNLFDEIISEKNLYRAIEIVNKTHRWHQYPYKPNKTVLWIESTKNERVKELKEIIENGFVAAPTVNKRRYDQNAKKWRDICEPQLWPDQYVHHALIQVLEPIMMRGMDNWCCGSIKGRGAHYGIKAIKRWMKNDYHGTRYCLEADIRHFYDSLDPQIVINRFKKLIKDYKTLDLIERITVDGVKIGCYCSQWFANTVLQELDHELRQKFDVSYYIRYMDNFTIFCNRKKTLHKVRKYIQKWLNKNGMELKYNWQVYPTKNRAVNALGYRFKHGYTLMRKNNYFHFKKQLKKYYKLKSQHKHISVKFAQGLLSRFGMLRHCDSVDIYKNLVQPKTQKELKNIVRKWQKEVTATWNTYLEQEREKAA